MRLHPYTTYIAADGSSRSICTQSDVADYAQDCAIKRGDTTPDQAHNWYVNNRARIRIPRGEIMVVRRSYRWKRPKLWEDYLSALRPYAPGIRTERDLQDKTREEVHGMAS